MPKRPAVAVTLTRQWGVLVALSERPRPVVLLARKFKTSKATIQRDIHTLAQFFPIREVERLGHKQRRYYAAELRAK
jgi:DNA-binding IclR family transcriptional regulator